jgi:hypothetical protein
VKGCHFHYSQAIIRNIRALGLFALYDKHNKCFNEEFNQLIRMTIALPLLPPEMVSVAWEEMIKDELLSLEVDELQLMNIRVCGFCMSLI